MLDTLAERYFHYLFSTYNIAERDAKRMQNLLSWAEKNERDAFKEISRFAAEQLKKIDKYFPTQAVELKRVIDVMKKPESIEQMKVYVDKYLKIVTSEEINQKLTINYVKSLYISPFYGQTSFLQKTFSAMTYDTHLKRMIKDFIEPARLEITFAELLQSAKSEEEIKDFLEKHKDYSGFKGWLKAIKKMKLSDTHQWFHENLLPCSFIDSLYATMNFEEMMFLPLGISRTNATNFFYDFNKINPIPMSAVARLILFLFPIGATFYNRQVGHGTAKETRRYAGIVLNSTRFADNYDANETYRNIRNEGGSFTDAVFGVLADVKQKAERSQRSLLFIEVHTDGSKKTVLDYYHMPAYASKYFSSNQSNALRVLFLKEEKDQFIRSILNGRDPKQEMFRYVREAIKNATHRTGALVMVQQRAKIMRVKKGVNEEMDEKQDKQIYVIYKQGIALQKRLEGKTNTETHDVYRADASKKIQGIAYRLLNSLKTGNPDSFLDTIMRLHVGVGLPVSSLFLDVLKKGGLDFETIGGAFIAGLLGEEYKEKPIGEEAK
ncbi:type I-B CRISPR-associated protein Cas8b1/Cst1 [Domibacillus indicus]|uniref:type I-B CRISPR-associated protein Cas8b1/Cst1 n=1 Tax=Domibacillus indicus TaxID=1437523 RepID=UPI0018CDFA78|nr:type I-B CRISPR-associated protein Cas8b1/Cst1 [Domibacillus indicus]